MTFAGDLLTLMGTGTGGILLSGANTYTGSTTVAAATTQLGSSVALGNAANTTNLTGGALDINGQTVTQSAITLGGGRLIDSNATPGSLVLTSTGAAFNINATYPATTALKTSNVTLSGATNFVTKSVNVGNPVTAGGFVLNGATTFALSDTSGDAAAELSVTGVVSGPGNLTLNNKSTVPGIGQIDTSDFGTLLLTGTNTYTGGTSINEGRIVVTNSGALGTGTIVIGQTSGGGGGTLQLGDGNYNATTAPLASGGITIANAINLGRAISGSYSDGLGNDNGANTLNGPITLTAATQTLLVNGTSLTMSGVIGQSAGVTASLTKSGTGSLILTGTNTYTGSTTVTAGTLSVSDLENGGVNSGIGASSNAPANLVLGGNSTLLYTGAGATIDHGFTMTSGGVTVDNANALTFGRQVLQASGSNSSFTKNNTGGQGGTGVINQNGGTVTSGGVVTMGGATGISGTYNLKGGTFTALSLAQGSGTGTLNFNGGTLRAPASDNPGTSTGTSTFVSGVAVNVGSSGATIDTQGFTVTVASALAPTSGSTGGLTKIGTGQSNLTANNTFTGATVINGGRLNIDNGSTTPVTTAGNLSATSVNQRIADTASITLMGGTLNLGGLSEGAAGTNGVGALTLMATSTLDFGTTGTSNLLSVA